ncbi:unnamed protein product [Lymnaea stagnalis]|uniref:Uncharacterized protein n=1 Tax=Lymnaea stagnalis TaxID=6523 RepID=A0AAV2HEZ8_LYMST
MSIIDMDSRGHFLVAAVCLSVCFLGAQSQSACQSNFVTTLTNCLTSKNMTTENFFWVARNGTMGKAASDMNAFMAKLCLEKSFLFTCVKVAVDSAQALPDAQCNQTQKTGLVNLFKGFFKTINKKCENPCRATFKQSLTKCYTDLNFKLSDFLIFSPTSARDYILGINSTEVSRFCSNRTQLIQCLRTAAQGCDDSATLLGAYGFDINAVNETYDVLCNYTAVYLETTKCFEFPINPVLTCRNAVSAKVTTLDSQLEDPAITDTQYMDEICRTRLNQLECEMKAVKADNDTVKCNSIVVGLRKQQECLLLPRQCRESNQNSVAALCMESDFMVAERTTLTLQLNSADHAQWAVTAMLVVFVSALFAMF